MMAGRFGAWLRLALLLLAGGALLLWSGAPWALAVAAVPALSGLSLLWALAARRSIRVTLSGPGTAEKGRSLRLQLSADWHLPPPGRVQCVLCVRNALTGEETPFTLPLRQGRAQWQLTAAHCGQLRITLREVLLWDSCGLLALRARCSAAQQITVLPDTFPVELPPELLQAPQEDASAASSRGDDPTELFALRDYAPGDPLHGIHWKLSAKTGRLLYRQSGQTEQRSLTLYWDPCGSPRQIDALGEAIFSVGQALTESGVPYTLAWTEAHALCQREISGGGPELLTELLAAGSDSGPVPVLPGRMLLFTCLPERIPPALDSPVLLCGEPAEAGGGVLSFRPEEAAQTLRRLDLTL